MIFFDEMHGHLVFARLILTAERSVFNGPDLFPVIYLYMSVLQRICRMLLIQQLLWSFLIPLLLGTIGNGYSGDS